MFAIAVDLLAERYTAMQFNDRSHPEWPPHPARLFSAMTAAWADDDEPDPHVRSALQWLEAQPPPIITCSDVRHRAVVTHFVPVNDPVAAKILPEDRGRQGRAYPTVVPDQPKFWFTWSDAQPSEQDRAALDRVLARVGRIGHSSTLVTCRCESSAPSPAWVPAEDGAGLTRIRVPGSGMLDRLEVAYQSHQGSEPRLLPARMVGYRRASIVAARPPVPLLGGDWLLLGLHSRQPPPAVRSLDIARAVRNALLAHGDQPSPEILSGHKFAGAGSGAQTPPLDGPHLAVVPLPNAGHQYSNGSILGVALICPAGCSEADRLAVQRAVRNWSESGFELMVAVRSGSSVRYKITDLGIDRASGGPWWLDSDLPARRRTTTRGYWCRPARRWLTVTPVALDRFPGNLRSPDPQVRDRAEREARESVARACQFAGLPGNPDVNIRFDAPLAGLPAAPAGNVRGSGFRGARYPGYRTGSGTPRVCMHAEIEFTERVSGPVLIGAGRYLGFGLCLPVDDKEAQT